MRNLALAFILFLGTTAFAAEVDTRSPLDRYQGDTAANLMLCRLAMRHVIVSSELAKYDASAVKGDPTAEYAKCQKDAKAGVTVSYQMLMKTLKKSSAREALKTYQVQWLSAMRGIDPSAEERKIDYQRREAEIDTKLNEAWSRVEIEL